MQIKDLYRMPAAGLLAEMPRYVAVVIEDGVRYKCGPSRLRSRRVRRVNLSPLRRDQHEFKTVLT